MYIYSSHNLTSLFQVNIAHFLETAKDLGVLGLMNEEGSALQTLTEPMSVDQTDDNIISVDVENEHVTNNKDDINTIDEEPVNILLPTPKIESMPENEIIENWETDEKIMFEVPHEARNTESLSQDGQCYIVKCNVCAIICYSEVSLKEHTLTHLDISVDYDNKITQTCKWFGFV